MKKKGVKADDVDVILEGVICGGDVSFRPDVGLGDHLRCEGCQAIAEGFGEGWRRRFV